jgi:hypothetical protein
VDGAGESARLDNLNWFEKGKLSSTRRPRMVRKIL